MVCGHPDSSQPATAAWQRKRGTGRDGRFEKQNMRCNAASERCGCKARAADLRTGRYTRGGTSNLVQQCRIGTSTSTNINISISISRTAIAGERADGTKMNVRWQNELARSCRLVGLVLGRMLVHTGQGSGATVGELLVHYIIPHVVRNGTDRRTLWEGSSFRLRNISFAALTVMQSVVMWPEREGGRSYG